MNTDEVINIIVIIISIIMIIYIYFFLIPEEIKELDEQAKKINWSKIGPIYSICGG